MNERRRLSVTIAGKARRRIESMNVPIDVLWLDQQAALARLVAEYVNEHPTALLGQTSVLALLDWNANRIREAQPTTQTATQP